MLVWSLFHLDDVGLHLGDLLSELPELSDALPFETRGQGLVAEQLFHFFVSAFVQVWVLELALRFLVLRCPFLHQIIYEMAGFPDGFLLCVRVSQLVISFGFLGQVGWQVFEVPFGQIPVLILLLRFDLRALLELSFGSGLENRFFR